jgi:flagellar biosynthesis/type III secretory pathway M-ring protein FliF/YscJ
MTDEAPARAQDIWDRLSARRPILFYLLLIAMTVAATAALLWRSASPVVLYQGF